MASEDGEFWDRRYSREGPIWGWDPSPTARAAAEHLPPGARVLDVGFGYGRDVAYLLRRGCRACGIDLSAEGARRARELLREQDLHPEALWTGRFEDAGFAPGSFDAVCCHRMIHLLLTREAAARFARRVAEVVRPDGLVCVGARNPSDLDPDAMTIVGDGVYEYRDRPGHRIRYWDDDAFAEVFGEDFRILSVVEAVEAESCQRPVPCRLSLMIGQRMADAAPRMQLRGPAGARLP